MRAARLVVPVITVVFFSFEGSAGPWMIIDPAFCTDPAGVPRVSPLGPLGPSNGGGVYLFPTGGGSSLHARGAFIHLFAFDLIRLDMVEPDLI